MIEKQPPQPSTDRKPWGELTENEKNQRLREIGAAPLSPMPDRAERVTTLANDRQVGGRHYRTAIQHWDFAHSNQFDYFQGQITKYVTRWKRKGGLQDLEKAKHFLDKYIELIKADDEKACDPQSRGYVNQD